MNSIKKIVDECKIDEKRQRKINNEKEMLHVWYLMSKTTMNQNAALYAYYLDYDEYYRSKKELTQEEKEKFAEGQIKMLELQDDVNVKTYIELKKIYKRLENECRNYYQAINIDLRKKLREAHLPNIFVYQGMFEKGTNLKLSRHIIIPNAFEIYERTPNMVIYPENGLKSKRDARHYFNRISFKYLEELSKDYDFDPKVKKLGKVYINDGNMF